MIYAVRELRSYFLSMFPTRIMTESRYGHANGAGSRRQRPAGTVREDGKRNTFVEVCVLSVIHGRRYDEGKRSEAC